MRRLVLAGFLVTCVPASPSLACSCVTGEPEGAIRHARIVFAMRVTDVEFQRRARMGYSRWLHHADVLAVWRGDVGESVVMVAMGSNCESRFEAGQSYLVYAHQMTADTMRTTICSRTGLLADRYYDRYLLGDPSVLYDPSIHPVTLDTMLSVLGREGLEADWMASQFYGLRPEADLVLPKLIRMARGDIPCNRLAVVRAIGNLGESAQNTTEVLRDIRYWSGKDDPELRAAALKSLMKVNPEFAEVRVDIARGLQDPAPEVRIVAIEQTAWLNRPYQHRPEIKRLMMPYLDDPDASVRCAVIELFRWWEYSPDVAREIKRMSRSDPDANVRSEADGYLELKYDRSRRAPAYRSVADRGFDHPTYRKLRR